MQFLNEDGATVFVLQFHSFSDALEPGSLSEELVSHHFCQKNYLTLPVATQSVIIHGYVAVLQNILPLPDMDHGEYCVFCSNFDADLDA